MAPCREFGIIHCRSMQQRSGVRTKSRSNADIWNSGPMPVACLCFSPRPYCLALVGQALREQTPPPQPRQHPLLLRLPQAPWLLVPVSGGKEVVYLFVWWGWQLKRGKGWQGDSHLAADTSPTSTPPQTSSTFSVNAASPARVWEAAALAC